MHCTSLIALMAPLLASAIPMAVDTRAATTDTHRDLQNHICRKYTLLYARGTSEPGNVGYGIGAELVEAMQNQLGAGNVAVQGIDYPAVDGGWGAMSAPGPDNVARAVRFAQNCPTPSQVILTGYSQGAMVVHWGAERLSPAEAGAIKGVVMFGDPMSSPGAPNPVQGVSENKVMRFCAPGDPICHNGADFNAHISYGTRTALGQLPTDIFSAAGFLKSLLS